MSSAFCRIRGSFSLFIQLQQAHLAVDFVDGAVCQAGGSLGTGLEHLINIRFIGKNLAVLGLDGGQRVGGDLGDSHLEVAVALALKLGGDLVHALAGEGAVDGHEVGNAGLIFAVEADAAVGIGDGALAFAHDGVLVVSHQDEGVDVGVGLAHLLGRLGQGHDLGAGGRDVALGQDEGIAVDAVEAAGDVAGDLQMLGLVLAHGDEVGVIDQNVGCHQDGVGEQAAVDVIGVFGALILELGHAGQLTELGVAGQHPGQLGVGRHVALDEEDMLLGIDADGQQQGGQLAGAAAQLSGVLADGQRVEVSDHIQAVVVRLQQGPVAHRADIVAQGGRAGGLDARKDAFTFFFCHRYISPIKTKHRPRTKIRAGAVSVVCFV